VVTPLLEKAFAKASRLPKAAQELLAEQLFAYIAGELKWDKMLAKSQDLLERLARQARSAHGRSRDLQEIQKCCKIAMGTRKRLP
jgi:hypothetical protein